jgi:glycosyltransferase involved in cell wall biosynthesis
VPCVASDLPGVRQPILETGMGKIIPIGDSNALAEAIIEVQEQRAHFSGDPDAIAQQYLPDTIAGEYEVLFQELIDARGKPAR